MQAYCMKCRTKREMRNARDINGKNGRPCCMKDSDLIKSLFCKYKHANHFVSYATLLP
jgi:hypothetical protein